MFMARSNSDRLEQALDQLDEYETHGEIDTTCASAIRTLIDTFNPDNVAVQNTTDEDDKSLTTLTDWCYRLIRLARHRDLTQATPADISNDLQAIYDGSHPYSTQSSGIKKSSLRPYQIALKAFYRFYDFNTKPDDIALFKTASTPVDDRDMLTREEIHALRDAADNPRDKMVADLIIYSGQRQQALRTLRLKDINLNDATYRYNTDDGGLKNADKRQGQRPLLLAESSVRTWINDYHPDTSNKDHYLITQRPGYSSPDPTEPISDTTMRDIMQKLKDRTDITKPCNPHAMRHNWVTLAVKEYGFKPDQVKFAIGHSKNSQVMETTYSHISAEDYTNQMKIKAGLEEPDDESPLTPEHCPSCHEPLSPTDKSCNKCGTVFAIDAAHAKEQLEQDKGDTKLETDSDEYRDKASEVIQFMDENPEIFEALQNEVTNDES
jgi:integrase/recombinase XerD